MATLAYFSAHLIASISLFFVTWLLILRSKKMGIVDVSWALGFALHAGIGLFIFQGSQIIIYSLVIMWATRLALFLFFTRIFKSKHDDARYADLLANTPQSPTRWSFLQCMFQALLQSVVSLAYLPPITSIQAISPLLILLSLLALFSILGEHWSDMSLLTFKKLNTDPQAVCTQGPWAFSRHPNYFFDCLFWSSIAGLSYLGSNTLVSFIGPLCLYAIMRFLTGPITEKLSLKKRPNSYKQYQKTTPMIIPFIGSKS